MLELLDHHGYQDSVQEQWRTPVFYVTAGITRKKVILVVGPSHAAEGFVVCRHDEFEGEVCAVPKGEFSLLVSCQEATTSGCPA